MKQERTPGPWRKVGDHFITGADEVLQVAEVYSAQDRDLIVHCVNTYDELVGALEIVLIEIDRSEFVRARGAVVAALKLAKGGG